MTVETIRSEEARRGWGTILENALRGITTVVERYNRPAAVIIGHREYERLLGARVQRLNAISQRMDEGDYLTLEEVENGLGD